MTTSPILEATGPTDVLIEALESVEPIAERCTIEVTDAGLDLGTVDKTNVAMVHTTLDAAAFETYEARSTRVGIDISQCLQALQAAQNEVVHVEIKSDGTELRVTPLGESDRGATDAPSHAIPSTTATGGGSEAESAPPSDPELDGAEIVAILSDEDQDAQTRKAALDMIERASDRIVDIDRYEEGEEAVIACLTDEDPAVQAAACRAVAALDLTQARDHLRDLQLSSDITVSEAARDALQELS